MYPSCIERLGMFSTDISFIFATSCAAPPSKLLRDAAGTQIPPFAASLGLSFEGTEHEGICALRIQMSPKKGITPTFLF